MKRIPWKATHMLAALAGFTLGVVLLSTATATPQGHGAGSSLVRFEEIAVSPVRRSDVHNLTEVGILDVDGYAAMVLNMGGIIAGDAEARGKVGVILIPEGYPFDQALEIEELFPFPIELTAEVFQGPRGAVFIADTKTVSIAFPRYRVLMYNEVPQSARVHFYVYRHR